MANNQAVDADLASDTLAVNVSAFLFVIYAYGNPRAVSAEEAQTPPPQVPNHGNNAPPDILVSASRVLEGLRKIAKQDVRPTQTQAGTSSSGGTEAAPIVDVNVANHIRHLEAKIQG
jgi:hypothetical protein